VLDRLLTPEFRDRRPDLAFLFQQMGTFNTAKMADLRNLGSDGPTFTELDAAPFPLLLLAGERDSVLSPATVRRAGEILGHARVEIVPGAPHSMYWETPSLFNDAVSRFLADVTATGVTRG
jgi:pimeloyl-ACP methyl ester carboxylesterase